MNVHLMPDGKFIDVVIQLADQLGGTNNRYLIKKKAPFTMVTSQKAEEGVLFSDKLNEVVSALTPNDKFIIHNLSLDICEWFQDQDIKAKTYWAFWGSEFFEASGIDFPLYGPLTKPHAEAITPASQLSKFWLVGKYRQMKKNKRRAARLKRNRDCFQRVVRKIDYFLHYNHYDLDLVKEYFDTPMKFQYFTYPLRHDYEEFQHADKEPAPLNIDPLRTNVFIGNSAYPNNNHREVFEQLKQHLSYDMDIWVPLSYGDDEYRAEIIELGTKMFAGQFKPITDYFDFQEYARIVAKMDIALMNHQRAQGFGNIQLQFYFGCKVYMHPQSTLFAFLREHGFAVNNILTEFDTLREPVGPNAKEQNRKLTKQLFSHEQSHEFMKKIVL